MRNTIPGNPRFRPASSAGRLAAWIGLALLASCAGSHAGELLGARFQVKPPRPYVNQPFELLLEIEVTPGAELQDLSIDGIPFETYATSQSFQPQPRVQVRRDKRTLDLLRFTSPRRALQPVRQSFAGVLRATLVERHSVGFFSSLSSSTTQVQLEPLLLEFRSLPATGAPAGFQGAIGSFALTGSIDPARVAPGDLVTLEYTLSGSGWLGSATLALSDYGPHFRVYPPQELQREETGRLRVRQVLIPLNTNACVIGGARLAYFDPGAETYREATAGPFRVEVSTNRTDAALPAVKRVTVAQEPATAQEQGEAAMAFTWGRAREGWPYAGVCLLAILVTGVWFGWRPRVAVAAGLAILIVGIPLCRQWIGRNHAGYREIREMAAARLCPSPRARVLFQVAPGRLVAPLESAGGWVRVDADGRRGWIPESAIGTPAADPDGTGTRKLNKIRQN